jgi:hypothetical protein
MTVVHHNVRSSSFIVNHIDAFQAFPVDFSPEYRATHNTVANHPEFEEWQCDSLGEENLADLGRDTGECISDNSDDDILEERGLLHKRRALLPRSEALTY